MKAAAKKLGSLVQGSLKGIRVIKRGASPRVMTAEIVGSRGTTPVTGATLRAKLGLFDTWVYFTSINSEAAPGRSVRRRPGAAAVRDGRAALRRRAAAARSIGPREGASLTVQALRGGAGSMSGRRPC